MVVQQSPIIGKLDDNNGKATHQNCYTTELSSSGFKVAQSLNFIYIIFANTSYVSITDVYYCYLWKDCLLRNRTSQVISAIIVIMSFGSRNFYKDFWTGFRETSSFITSSFRGKHEFNWLTWLFRWRAEEESIIQTWLRLRWASWLLSCALSVDKWSFYSPEYATTSSRVVLQPKSTNEQIRISRQALGWI